jgi:EmrB/QacA subfamily drug resistance transporter
MASQQGTVEDAGERGAVRGRGLRGHPGLTLVSVSFGLMMVALDSTIVAVANPVVGAHFHASLPGLQWVTNAYLLALAVGLITGGKLGDHFGRKRIFLIGTAGFALSSLACGLSPTLGALIGFRAAQGAFGALMLPQTLAILRATFPLERLAAAVGTWAATSSIGTASGPILGGVLVGELDWRWIFFVNLPVGAASLAVGSVVIRESRDDRENRRLDPGGIGLLSAALFCLVWGLMQAEQHGWARAGTLGWLAGAAVAVAAFIAWEGRARMPHIPLRLFRSVQLDAGLAMIVTGVFGIYGVLFFVTLYLQRVQGDTAIGAGVRLLAFTGVMGVSAVIAGRAVAKIGPRIPLFIGSLVISAGLAGLSRLGPASDYNHLWPFLALVGLGVGPLQTGASRAVVGGAPPENAGIAGGMFSTATQLGGLLGLSVLGTVIVDRVSSVLPAKLASAAVPTELARQLRGHSAAIAQGVVPAAGNLPTATAHAVTTGAYSAFTSGLDLAMLVTAAFVLAIGLVTLALSSKKSVSVR